MSSCSVPSTFMYKVTRPKSIRLRPDSYAAARVQESCRPSGAPGTAAATRDWKGGGHASRRQRVYAAAPPGQEKGVASSASAAGSTPTLTMCLATASPSPSYSSWSPRRKAMPKEKRTEDSISPGGWFSIKFRSFCFFNWVGPLMMFHSSVLQVDKFLYYLLLVKTKSGQCGGGRGD